jgi:hypothetical protein
MAEYVTSVVEIREAGIPLHAEGEHVVRVLGAVPRLQVDARSGTKSELTTQDTSAIARFLAGEIQPPPPEAGAPPDPFNVPDVVVTASGDIEFLKRGGLA